MTTIDDYCPACGHQHDDLTCRAALITYEEDEAICGCQETAA